MIRRSTASLSGGGNRHLIPIWSMSMRTTTAACKLIFSSLQHRRCRVMTNVDVALPKVSTS